MKKVVVIGPESTGKSTLCQQLASHFQTVWVKEFARDYLLSHGPAYSYDDLLEIARGQLKLEENTLQQMPEQSRASFPVFIDTDLNVMKVWCEFAFNQCHPWILDQIATCSYDLYLLTNIDIPWENDPLREYPDPLMRKRIYQHYKDIMINQNVPWVDISGNQAERLHKAIIAVDELMH